MPAPPSARLIAVLFGVALATPSAAETFTVNGALVESVDGLDGSILNYAENYPPPTPAHAARRLHAARSRRGASVLVYSPPCLLSDGRATVAVSCPMVPPLVGEPLQ